MTVKTATTHKKWLPKHQKWVHFVHRDAMARKKPMAKAHWPTAEVVPATTLPVDCTGNQTVSCPMDGNDTLGICGPADLAHLFNILTYGQGKTGFFENTINLAALESQYETYSGGDNGTDESMLVGTGSMTAPGNGLAGDSSLVIADHLDVDVTDTALRNYCADQFYGINQAWSVPDAFLQGFATGTVWPSAMTPDPDNGHYSLLSDVGGPATIVDGTNCDGFHTLWTWGGFCWVSPAFIASVQPQCFVAFSAKQFNSLGYDSHGRHVSQQAAKWVAIGGNATAVAAVVAQFPAIVPTPAPSPTPNPSPTPTVTGVTLAQAQGAVQSALAASELFVLWRSSAEHIVAKALASIQGWPTA